MRRAVVVLSSLAFSSAVLIAPNAHAKDAFCSSIAEFPTYAHSLAGFDFVKDPGAARKKIGTTTKNMKSLEGKAPAALKGDLKKVRESFTKVGDSVKKLNTKDPKTLGAAIAGVTAATGPEFVASLQKIDKFALACGIK